MKIFGFFDSCVFIVVFIRIDFYFEGKIIWKIGCLLVIYVFYFCNMSCFYRCNVRVVFLWVVSVS